jgi:hypothetical protein
MLLLNSNFVKRERESKQQCSKKVRGVLTGMELLNSNVVKREAES